MDPEDNGKTYFLDVDGTLVKHLNTVELDDMLKEDAHKDEELLPGVLDLWQRIMPEDCVIVTTARNERHRKITENIFKRHNLRFDLMIMDLPWGPRILINDTPDIFWKKAVAINVKRDAGFA